MTDKQNSLHMEILPQGGPVLLMSIVVRAARLSNVLPVEIRDEWTSDFYRAIAFDLHEDERPVWGFAELQATPGGRTLMRLWCVDSYAESSFRALCQALVEDLVKVGALEVPDASKGPIGFHIERTKLNRVIPGTVTIMPKTEDPPQEPTIPPEEAGRAPRAIA